MVISRACLWAKHLCRAPDLAAVGTILNVFGYDAVSARDLNLSPPQRRADALRVDLYII